MGYKFSFVYSVKYDLFFFFSRGLDLIGWDRKFHYFVSVTAYIRISHELMHAYHQNEIRNLFLGFNLL